MHKVLIRPLEVEDSKISWIWRNDSEVWEYTGSRPDTYITPEIERDWIIRVLNENTSRRFAIIADDNYIGNIQLTGITSNSAEYHIFIGEKDQWGKGIASLATYQILYFAKVELNLKSVFLSVRKSNTKAINSYKRNSFTELGVDGEWIKMECDLALLPPATVSVFVMTFNHEKYLNKCLDGILMQKCNFNFDIVVGEDSSTDCSREILLNYKTKYPGKFKLLLHEKNIGASANQSAVFNACSGKYIALCEGDDYWTDPNKLQKQVDFLEANKDFSLCFHNMKVIENNKTIRYTNSNLEKDVYSINDLAIGNFIYTASCVFKNKIDYSTILKNVSSPVGDYVLFMHCSKYGKLKFFKESMGVYRIHDGGIWSSKTYVENYTKWIRVIELMRDDFSQEVQTLLNKQIIFAIRQLLNSENDTISAENIKALEKKALELFPDCYQQEIKSNFVLRKTLESHHSIKILLKLLLIELMDRLGIKKRKKQ